MSNRFFKFKQFTVYHDLCAMKVGTDGVLLGAWTDTKNAASILDVGTGTGLIALMLAQRNDTAKIDAIDIDKDACKQAENNVSGSVFAERINIIHQSFLEYETPQKYDLIVSNPPYFKHSLKNPDAKRTIARHNDSLPLKPLIKKSISMLSDNGIIALILPTQLAEDLNFIVATHGLYVVRRTNIVSVEGLPAKRFMIEMSKKICVKPKIDTLIIESGNHEKTDKYKELTAPFYLDLGKKN